MPEGRIRRNLNGICSDDNIIYITVFGIRTWLVTKVLVHIERPICCLRTARDCLFIFISIKCCSVLFCSFKYMLKYAFHKQQQRTCVLL